MAYTLLAISHDKNILDDVEYYTRKMRDDINIIKETDISEGINFFHRERHSVLFINTTFIEEHDGYQAVLNLRKSHYKFLPIILFNQKAIYDFQLQAFRDIQCIDFLTGEFQKNRFIYTKKI